MKSLIAIVFCFFFAIAAQAQDRKLEKVVTLEKGIVTVTVTQAKQEFQGNEVARLYRRSGSRVRKALDFATKRNHDVV